MKKIFIYTFSFFNRLLLLSRNASIRSLTGTFFGVRISAAKHNHISFQLSELHKSVINVRGKSNTLNVSKAIFSEVELSVTGNHNQIVIGEGVRLSKSTIIIRGERCKILIGNRSTFGGVRIINVGCENEIVIGEECLFSDNIEIWASDTHTIYDASGNWINKEKPVHIGNKVWVGSRVIILKGITLGDGSIIGMGSIVTKDVPANTISVGSPNKVLRESVSWELNYPTSSKSNL